MTTWADVAKGDTVELGGNEWRVEKIKPKGKRAKVTVTSARGTFTSEVKLKDDVKVTHKPSPDLKAFTDRVLERSEKRKALHDDAGAQTRWAVTSDEADATVADSARANVERILGAKLIGESHDGGKEWFVPPVDVSTVTSHWMTFHGGDTWHTTSSSDLLPLHAAEHAAAAAGTRILEVAHTHVEDRISGGSQS